MSIKCLGQQHQPYLVRLPCFLKKFQKITNNLVRGLSANAYIYSLFHQKVPAQTFFTGTSFVELRSSLFSNIFQWVKPKGFLPVKQFLETYMLNVFYFLCCVVYKFLYSFMLQDEDADFLAKLAKLMGAAGTQLLNSYNK